MGPFREHEGVQFPLKINPRTLASSVADLQLRALKARVLKGREMGLGLSLWITCEQLGGQGGALPPSITLDGFEV